MKHARVFRLSAPLLAAGLAVGCGDGPTEQDYDDIAQATGALVAGEGGEVTGMEDAVATAEGEAPAVMSRAGEGTWTGSRGQLDYTYELTCRDAAGAAQARCDETTDQAQLVLSWDGEVTTARRYAQMSRTGDWTLTGLTTETAELNGTGTFMLDTEFEALFRPVMRSLSLDYRADYRSVMIDVASRSPVSGEVTYQVSAARTESRRFRDVDASFDVTATVTFQGDGTALLDLDGERQYVVTLTSGEVVYQGSAETGA